ncbi:medium-chain acyl-CoA ligase ACSF2, mitochondrial isoform X2 [Tribolium madens]|uniref:medium-chain acyl-CoA ligase ACSF2, mitochondrial isoform X2 n=1 Tax=Tribolium madens TaxID=41895 RepID=UPI001CF75F44|nr:medium-chain acyl-CoA ligase ACSF2, mitochondrial isoform X2 [Tribolium madens]
MLKTVTSKYTRLSLIKKSKCSHYSTKLSYKHNLGEEPLRHITIGTLLDETVSKFGDRKALISRHQKKSLTFSEILNQTDKLAAGFKELGLEKNDRVGLWAPNLIEWYIGKMACARAGLIMVGLNPAYQPPEIEYCINKVGIKAIVCADQFKSQNFYENLATVAPELEKSDPGKLKSNNIPSLQTVIIMSENKKKGAYNFGEILDLATNDSIAQIRKYQRYISPDDPCNLQFTSGTTGKPKAALTSHFNMVNNGYLIGKRNELNQKHHTICLQVPFFHAFGTSISIMAALNHGATMVLPTDGYNPDKSLDAIKEEKCTIIHGTPTMYVDLVHKQEIRKENISPEIAVAGGALCAPHLFKKMLSVLNLKKVKSVYGLTETTAVVFQSMVTEDEEKAVSTVGHVGEHVEVKIVDKDGVVVPCGTPGELCIRAYCNMLGYWEDEAKTKEMIGSDNWLMTGDQFILEEDGYGKVVGRLKEMIIRGGENIFPKEIEEFLNSHPNILETHVIGLPHERLGEEVCACIRVKPGTNVTFEDIVSFCKGKLAHFKIPSKLKIVEEFPKTTSGKIQKFKLKDLFTST